MQGGAGGEAPMICLKRLFYMVVVFRLLCQVFDCQTVNDPCEQSQLPRTGRKMNPVIVHSIQK